MNSLTIKGVEIGKGIPKICVPLVGRNKQEVLKEIAMLENVPHQIVEWRADYFGDTLDIDGIVSFLSEINRLLKKKIVLFTFRSENEGGAKSITGKDYFTLNEKVITSGKADIVDVELFIGDDIVKRLVHSANNNNTYILMSNHDFKETPNRETLIKRFCVMQELGADISKIAVMPSTIRDVATIINVMVEMEECYADKPFVAVSMAEYGVISRVAGEIFGSAITFGAIGKKSAPGQLNAAELDTVLKIIHGNLRQNK